MKFGGLDGKQSVPQKAEKWVAIVRITHSKGLSYSVGYIDDEEQYPS